MSIHQIEKKMAADRAAVAGIAGCGNVTTGPIDIREVPAQLDQLREAISDLHCAIARLRDRLLPTLAPGDNSAELKDPPPSLSQLGEQLRSHRESIHSATRILVALESGCQL